MSVPDEDLTNCTLLVQRSPQALTDYHTMLFPPHLIRQTKHAREEVDMILKVNSFTKHFLSKESKISLVYIKLFVVYYLYFYCILRKM